MIFKATVQIWCGSDQFRSRGARAVQSPSLRCLPRRFLVAGGLRAPSARCLVDSFLHTVDTHPSSYRPWQPFCLPSASLGIVLSVSLFASRPHSSPRYVVPCISWVRVFSTFRSCDAPPRQGVALVAPTSVGVDFRVPLRCSLRGFWLAQLVCSRQLLLLHGRMHAMPVGDRCLQSVGLFQVAAITPGSWVSHCVESEAIPQETSLTDKEGEVARRIPKAACRSKRDVHATCEGRPIRRSDVWKSCGIGDGNKVRGGGLLNDKKHKAEKKQASSKRSAGEAKSDKDAVIWTTEDSEVSEVRRVEDMSEGSDEVEQKMEGYLSAARDFFLWDGARDKWRCRSVESGGQWRGRRKERETQKGNKPQSRSKTSECVSERRRTLKGDARTEHRRTRRHECP